MHYHGAGLENSSAGPTRDGQESILITMGFGQIQPAHHSKSGIADYPPFDFARSLLCADQRITPRLRPRSEMSSSTSLIGLQPSRGAYLFSSSSTTKTRGRAVPAVSLSSNILRSTMPTTNRFARS